MRPILPCIAAIAIGAVPAQAEPVVRANTCDTHGEVVRALSIRFGEIRRDGRVSGADYALEIWSSVFGGWTVLMVRPDGLTCVTTDGDLWQETPTGTPAPDGQSSTGPVGKSA